MVAKGGDPCALRLNMLGLWDRCGRLASLPPRVGIFARFVRKSTANFGFLPGFEADPGQSKPLGHYLGDHQYDFSGSVQARYPA